MDDLKILISVIALLLAANPECFARSPERPNVIILYADDMGVADVSYGDRQAPIQTPNLDRLAAEGMRFTDGHSSSGICTPSRFALLTGQYHWRRFHGIVRAFEGPVFEPDDFTIAKMFREQGYRTGCFGKWHLGWDWDAIRKPGVTQDDQTKADSYDWTRRFPGGPVDHGFDHYFGDGTINFPPYCWIENDRFVTIPTQPVIKSEPLAGGGNFRPGPMAESWNPYDILPTITQKAVEWMSAHRGEEPFFLYLAFNSPHYPIVPNPPFHGKSGAGFYGDFVMETDAMVGQVLNALDELGLADNTLVVFSADNGAETHAFERLEKFGQWSSGAHRGLKRDLYEGGHRVPFIVRWPGHVRPGSVSHEVVSQVDLAATFSAMMNHPLGEDEAIDSHDLSPVLLGENYDRPLRKATVQNTWPDEYALRQGDWLLIDAPTGTRQKEPPAYLEHFQMESFGSQGPGLLFNLREDPRQTTNLHPQYPEKVASMRRLLKEYIAGKRSAPYPAE